jgi:maltose-binding protein MalE
MSERGLPTNLRVAREVIAENTRQPENIAALLKATDSLYPTPRVPNLSEIMSRYHEGASGVSAGRVTPAEAMERAEQRINLCLKRRRR